MSRRAVRRRKRESSSLLMDALNGQVSGGQEAGWPASVSPARARALGAASGRAPVGQHVFLVRRGHLNVSPPAAACA